ncbi:MAG: peptidoglycan editing factor PgeF [Planctomycetota bacterium]
MLVEVRHAAGPTILRSPLLAAAGFSHAFSTRLGGVSAPPFESLNLQSVQANARIPAGDPRDSDANILENHARFAAAAGLARDATVADVSQVHGCTVILSSDALRERTAADAIVSPRGSSAILIRIADCVPVLLADPRTGAVAAVHAGWRGVVAEVVPAAVKALKAHGADPDDLRAAVGPCISATHFEIGPEVADALSAVGLASCVHAPGIHGPRHHADLAHAVRLQLARAGLASAHIDAEPPCTYADRARFHSYRRDGVASGRLAAIIAPRQA